MYKILTIIALFGYLLGFLALIGSPFMQEQMVLIIWNNIQLYYSPPDWETTAIIWNSVIIIFWIRGFYKRT